MGKYIQYFLVVLLLLLLAAPQELAAQSLFYRLTKMGGYNKEKKVGKSMRNSCGFMAAYNKNKAYRKHKRKGSAKIMAKRSPAINKDRTTQPKQPASGTPPGNAITSTKKPDGTTQPPAPQQSTTEGPAPKPKNPPTVSKKTPVLPTNADSVAAKITAKLTREALKKMTIEQRRDTLEKTQPVIVLPPIQFISDQDEFSVVNMDSFMQAMEYAQQGKVVLIEGHTDDLGSENYNLQLSMKRAEKIRQLLLSGDVSDELISVIGYGESKPVVPNTSAANRAINRRIEFKIFSVD